MKSIENMQQARTRAIRARQRFEDLLSVSLRHRERVRSRQRAENESIARITREARDQHRRQAGYERRLRSNVLKADERQDIKPPPISSILLESRSTSTSLSRTQYDDDMSFQDLGVSVPVPRRIPPPSPGPRNPGRMGVDDWVHYTQLHPPSPPADGHDYLSADPSGGRCARSPPAGNGYPGAQCNRNHTAFQSHARPTQ